MRKIHKLSMQIVLKFLRIKLKVRGTYEGKQTFNGQKEQIHIRGTLKKINFMIKVKRRKLAVIDF